MLSLPTLNVISRFTIIEDTMTVTIFPCVHLGLRATTLSLYAWVALLCREYPGPLAHLAWVSITIVYFLYSRTVVILPREITAAFLL
jgi:hypothetical protein